jgi:hypothetical protein
LRRVAEIGRAAASPLRIVEVPVGTYAPTVPTLTAES